MVDGRGDFILHGLDQYYIFWISLVPFFKVPSVKVVKVVVAAMMDASRVAVITVKYGLAVVVIRIIVGFCVVVVKNVMTDVDE